MKKIILWDTASQYKKNQKSDGWQSKQSLFHMLMLLMGIALLSASSCKKDPVATDSYPAVTSEGKNIWACKINGSPVVYSGKQGFTGGGVVASVYNTGSNINSIIISGSGEGFKGFFDIQHINFNVENPIIGEKYFFNLDNCWIEYSNHGLGLGDIPYGYWKSYNSSGWIKFSSISNIVSGEYELNLINIPDTSYPISIDYDTLFLTDGRFDIKR